MSQLTVLSAGRRLLVRCGGELSEGTISLLEAQLAAHLASARSVVLDLSRLDFANSAGLRWLARFDDGLRQQHKPLHVLVRSGSSVDRALSLTGYDRLFDLHRSGRDAWHA